MTPGFLGWCGLFPLEDSGLIEIGYRYVTSAWGRGIATEAARAVLDHGFRALCFDPIVAVTHPANLASQHVLAKIGLTACGSAFHYGQWLRFFQLSRAAYLSAEPGPTGRRRPPARRGPDPALGARPGHRATSGVSARTSADGDARSAEAQREQPGTPPLHPAAAG